VLLGQGDQFCLSACPSACALKGKQLELSTPNSVEVCTDHVVKRSKLGLGYDGERHGSAC